MCACKNSARSSLLALAKFWTKFCCEILLGTVDKVLDVRGGRNCPRPVPLCATLSEMGSLETSMFVSWTRERSRAPYWNQSCHILNKCCLTLTRQLFWRLRERSTAAGVKWPRSRRPVALFSAALWLCCVFFSPVSVNFGFNAAPSGRTIRNFKAWS